MNGPRPAERSEAPKGQALESAPTEAPEERGEHPTPEHAAGGDL
jgi:hypothetical protein